MIYKNWLQTESLSVKTLDCPPLKENIKTDCLIIGGGITGLHAALRLIDSGKEVVLLEKDVCGSSSSGQSAGFLTPDSEEDFQKLIQRYGEEKAKIIYHIPLKGVSLIVDNINKYNFKCDLRKQDSLYFSTKSSHNAVITEEAEAREANGFPYQLLNRAQLKKVHPGKGYLKGLRYPGSYGINSFAYCQEMKNLLLKKGVKIYEESEVHKIEGNTANTHLGTVTAEDIFICIDKMKTEFNKDFSKKYYHIQTYVAVSEPLSDKEMKDIFPEGELMCWDTRWDYIHYRPITDNRIIIGGSSPWTAYLPYYKYSPKVISSFIKKLRKSFPTIDDVEFNYYWAGMLDVTKDLVPIVDYDKGNKTIQYAMGCAGLNWAAYCGDYIARRVIEPDKTEDLSEFLEADRKFWVSNSIQNILGKRISFFINHVYELLRK
ncbi:MAG TPA: FAD-dependent oxidoreductase [Candidatus Paceibacterota bacterium]|nr:FAD-dependent oxidoreductase [Candidatus Paceibacterota bacterium]